MSAYLNTRVSLYASRLWQDSDLDALVEMPDEAVADALVHHGLPQLGTGYKQPADRLNDSRSLEQRIIAQVLDETRVMMRALSGEARSFLAFWTERFEISNVRRTQRTPQNCCAVSTPAPTPASFGPHGVPSSRVATPSVWMRHWTEAITKVWSHTPGPWRNRTRQCGA